MMNDSPISDADLAPLPEPIARYLRRCGVVGRRPIRTAHLRQRGAFKMSESSGWATMTAEQRFTVDPPSFVWRATIMPFALVPVKVVDAFTAGRGFLEAKLFGCVAVARASGPETDQGELLRFMSEIAWFPTAWLSDYISWQAVDARSARVTIRHEDITANALVSFDDRDRIASMEARRYRIVGARYSLETWVTRVCRYAEIGGLEVPLAAEALWRSPAGDFVYFKGEISDLEFDAPKPPSEAAISFGGRPVVVR
jgi:Family of unknown function (DUF6544)